MHELGDLGHVAAVGSLMEDDVHPIERQLPIAAATDIPPDELRVRCEPGWLAVAMSLALGVIEHPHVPPRRQCLIDDMRPDQSRAARNERGFRSTHPLLLSFRQ